MAQFSKSSTYFIFESISSEESDESSTYLFFKGISFEEIEESSFSIDMIIIIRYILVQIEQHGKPSFLQINCYVFIRAKYLVLEHLISHNEYLGILVPSPMAQIQMSEQEDNNPAQSLNESLIPKQSPQDPYSKEDADPKQQDSTYNLKDNIEKYGWFWGEFGRFSGSHMNNHIVKYIYLFLLYLSYSLVVISVLLITLQGSEDKDLLVAYVTKDGNLVLLVSLLVLGAAIYILYQTFSTNKNYQAKTRKALNMFIDLLRAIFHVLYVVYIFPFINQNKNIRLMYLSFWLLLASFAIFIIRVTFKWVHFYCGSGRDNLSIWQQPFTMDVTKMHQQFQNIQKIKQTILQLAGKGGQAGQSGVQEGQKGNKNKKDNKDKEQKKKKGSQS